MKSPEPLQGFDTIALAKRWGMSKSTLENWRNLGKGPAYRKIGGKVLYMLDDVIEFEQASKRTSTSQAA